MKQAQTDIYIYTNVSSYDHIPVLDWEEIFKEYCQRDSDMRFRVQGTSSYELKEDTFMFTFNNAIYISKIGQEERIDPKLGGHHNNKIAFIRNRDIWVMDFDGNETQLTFCSLDTTDPTLNCGGVEYMMQEEFYRYTGYYWAPPNPNESVERILYLETSEEQVELLQISKPAMSSSGTDPLTDQADSIRYPYAGKPNAVSKIKIIEFGEDQIVNKQLWGKNDLQSQFSWMEYIVRFGWLPDGQSVWVQILSRDQKHTAVLKLSLDQFQPNPINTETEILWEEVSHAWINVTDVYYFMKHSNSITTRFIWSSEKSNGYRHLYFVEKWKGKPSIITQLTEGEWCCLDKPIYVDESRGLVYFSAKADTPLESHFYAASYTHPSRRIKRLTKLGFSHMVTMNSPDHFVDCFSSLHHPHVISIQSIQHGSLLLPYSSQPKSLILPICRVASDQESLSPTFISDTLFMHANTKAFGVDKHEEEKSLEYQGVKLYGCLYKPRSYKAGCRYPTILHVYGGPKSQMVMNDFKLPRLIRYLMSVYFGFAVVIIDSRGSCDRGLQFESYIQQRLGTVELKDQIEGLKYLHHTKFGASKTNDGEEVSVIDLTRLAITGWSYGGYLSLMALGQHPDIFKIAIAGAPVTRWELYDAAYTERYMGLPSENQQAYTKSSVLQYVQNFPDKQENEHRLLIAHGLIDENVHYINTEVLVEELDKHGKSYRLQVYPNEKHGLRHASSNEHFETLMFSWLTNYL
ncbi:hypothetical protein G6F49_002035 [Rhizopus delemar]|nr:hypothetical protein G6F49_002035 [Rhizopus delemar]